MQPNATMTNTAWLHIALSFTSIAFVGAFSVRPQTVGIFSSDTTTMTMTSWLGKGMTLMSTPGSWENDDFLESLSGKSGNAAGSRNTDNNSSEEGPVERFIPENDLTDEEITAMAMRAAQFYNTDKSIDEAYGIPRSGPPKKNDEDESEFQ